MTESSAFVVGGGGFVRVRDSSNGFSVEFRRKQQLEEERQRQEQMEQDRRDRIRAEEEEKRRAANEAKAVQAFRDFHDPAKRGEITANCMKYAEARGYYRENYKLANAELLNPEFIKVYHPTKFAQMEHAKADAATLDPIVKCPKCRLITNRGYRCQCFQVGSKFGTLTVVEFKDNFCIAKCQCGREGLCTRRDLEDGITVCMVCDRKEKETE